MGEYSRVSILGGVFLKGVSVKTTPFDIRGIPETKFRSFYLPLDGNSHEPRIDLVISMGFCGCVLLED